MDDVVVELRNIIAKKDSSSATDHLLMNKHYTPLPIEKSNFHEIARSGSSNSRILFIDGGDSILFDCPDFCLGFIRAAGLVYENNKRISRYIMEFYVLVTGDTKYYVRTFPKTSFDGLIFDPDDELLRMGKEKCTLSRVVSLIRRFAELGYAKELDNPDIDFIILDGTLEARYPHEQGYLDTLMQKKKTCSLSKTCSLMTNNSFSIIKKLIDMNSGTWYYYPIVENNNPEHKADIYFVKFSNADYAFRFEIQQEFIGDANDLFSNLYSLSRDPIFLGYPYGLIDVDQNARIPEEETKMLRTKFALRLGKDWNELSKSLNSMNAHDILDKIRF